MHGYLGEGEAADHVRDALLMSPSSMLDVSAAVPPSNRRRPVVEEPAIVSGGGALGALVHVPESREDRERSPAVVMAHGLANDRDEAGQFPPLAEQLVANGNVVVRFDFRGGVRDVDPGRQLPASQWPDDLLAAIAYVRSREDVDPERVVVVGSSCGGSVALHVASVDARLCGVITLGAFADGERWLRELWAGVHGVRRWERFLQELAEDRRLRAEGRPSRRVALAGEFLPVRDEELAQLQQFVTAHPGMLDRLALETADDVFLLSPESCAADVTCPVLVVHGSDDTLVPLDEAERLGRALGARAERVTLDEAPHQLLLAVDRDRLVRSLADWVCNRTN